MDFDSTLFETSASRELRVVKGSRKDWNAIYACIPKFHLYDGWDKVLSRMQERGIRFGIISAAKTELIDNTLSHFGIRCDAVVGYQRYIKKPSPRLMEMALKKLNLQPDEVVYIGDCKEDEQMSRASGVRFYGALWDSTDRDHLTTHASTLNTPEEILTKFRMMSLECSC